MSRMEASNLRPVWRFGHHLNKQKITNEAGPRKKMLIYYDQSRYVYENKENYDRMSGKMSGIYGKVTLILQNIADVQGQFDVNCAFRACWVGKSAA